MKVSDAQKATSAQQLKSAFVDALVHDKPSIIKGNTYTFSFAGDTIYAHRVDGANADKAYEKEIASIFEEVIGVRLVAFASGHYSSMKFVPGPYQNEEWMGYIQQFRKRLSRR